MNASGGRLGFARPLGRALLLRCPRCGARGIVDGWFRLKDTCSVCALDLRGRPGDDDWFGGYLMNLIASELLAVAIVVAYVLWKWPSVPWTTVEVLGIGMAIASPVASYPFGQAAWVAVELVFAERAGPPESRRT